MVGRPVTLAAIARHTLTGSLEGAGQGYSTARTELGETIPPHAVDAALKAYRDEGVGSPPPCADWNWSSVRCAGNRF